MPFNFDWWFDSPYRERTDEARRRCALSHFSSLSPEKAEKDKKFKKFFDELEVRTIVYLRDGFSYEIKEIIEQPTTTTMTFECMPADEAYKVGCFVVTIPFEDIVRVEVFAVHPAEKPEDMPSIKGFGSAQLPPKPQPPAKERQPRPESAE
ncbi:MAG TPA: hypothetical protein P5081_15310 [Phycisphaerae bacterium]|nr:hypothetical protein [Phycisphaerae bacterium]HRW54239.1 hypothetical protein [Phycisphaerae bacterium]